MTVDRYSKVVPVENIYIVTNRQYAGLVRAQLPELGGDQILLEPSRRNTAPCIAYASYHIREVNPSARIVVGSSDHLVRNDGDFVEAVSKGLYFVGEEEVLVTLGVKPSRAETSYGYIQRGEDKIEEFVKVKTFVEKPNAEMAKVFVDTGEFYWNAGIFMWKVGTIIKALERWLPEVAERFAGYGEALKGGKVDAYMEKEFGCCPNISVDYGVMEKAENVYMLGVDFGWADLGTWGSLYDLGGDKDELGNVLLRKNKVLLYESKGNLVSLEEGERLVVLEGLEDYIVAETGGVLMICRRSEEGRIKQFVADARLQYGEAFS